MTALGTFDLCADRPSLFVGPFVGSGGFQFTSPFRMDTSVFNRFRWRMWKSGLGQPYEPLATTDSFSVQIQTSAEATTNFIAIQGTTEATAPTTGTSFYERVTNTTTNEWFRIRWNFADKTLTSPVDRVSRVDPTGTAGASGHTTDAGESYPFLGAGTYSYQGLHIQHPHCPPPPKGYPVMLVGSLNPNANLEGNQGDYEITTTVPGGTVDGAQYTTMGPIALDKGYVYVHFGLTGQDSRANDGSTALPDNGMIRRPDTTQFRNENVTSPIKEFGQVIQYLRENAADLNINPDQILVYGFRTAALCAMAAAYWPDLKDLESADPKRQHSSLPTGIIVEQPDAYYGANSIAYAGTFARLFASTDGVTPSTSFAQAGFGEDLIPCSPTEAMQNKLTATQGLAIPLAIIGEDNTDGTSAQSLGVQAIPSTEALPAYKVEGKRFFRPLLANQFPSLNTSWQALMLRRVHKLAVKQHVANPEAGSRLWVAGTANPHVVPGAIEAIDEIVADRVIAQKQALTWIEDRVDPKITSMSQGTEEKACFFLEIIGEQG